LRWSKCWGRARRETVVASVSTKLIRFVLIVAKFGTPPRAHRKPTTIPIALYVVHPEFLVDCVVARVRTFSTGLLTNVKSSMTRNTQSQLPIGSFCKPNTPPFAPLLVNKKRVN